jgi:chemotaxis protein MotB
MGRWLLTYSDMITLLLALFIILFAISTINAKKFLAFKMGITQSFNNVVQQTSHDGILPTQDALSAQPTITTSMTSTLPKSASTTKTAHSDLTKIQAELSQQLAAVGLSSVTSVSRTEQGVVVEIFADKAYFANDRATLQPLGDKVIDTIGAVLRTVPNHVEVQGYTDNVPITGGPYVSNWELSGARAAAAVVRLETVDKITANRLSAVGFGTTHPVASNATAAGRAQNRRIDVVVLATTVPAPGATSTQKMVVP